MDNYYNLTITEMNEFTNLARKILINNGWQEMKISLLPDNDIHIRRIINEKGKDIS